MNEYRNIFLTIFAAMMMMGCEGIPSTAHYDAKEYGADIVCTDTPQCAKDEACTMQRCTPEAAESYEVGLRLTYPDAPGHPVTLYRSTVSGQSIGDFIQPDALNATVSVVRDNVYLPGTLTLTPADAWNGLEDAQSYQLAADKSPIQAYAGEYNVTFFPTNTGDLQNLPVMYFDHVTIDENHPDIAFNLTSNLGSIPDNSQWMGTLTLNYGTQKAPIQAPGNNADENDDGGTLSSNPLTLRIYDTESPAATALISLEGIDSPNKPFTTIDIALPPQKTNTKRTYRVEAARKLTNTLKITHLLDTIELNTSSTAPNIDKLLHDYTVNLWTFTEFTGQILAPSAKNPINGIVTVSASDKKGDYQWKSTAHAPVSSDGYFTIDIPVLDENIDFLYTVNVTFENDHALAAETFEFSSLDDLKAINVTEKTEVSGVVYRPDGITPMPGVTVSFKPRDIDVSSTIETQTDESGHFTAHVNHRLYAVTTIPPRTSGIPEGFVSLDTRDGSPASLNYTMPQNRLIYGTCRNPQGTMQPGVRAEVFVKPQNGRVRKAATSESDENGVFRLFVMPGLTKQDDEIELL